MSPANDKELVALDFTIMKIDLAIGIFCADLLLMEMFEYRKRPTSSACALHKVPTKKASPAASFRKLCSLLICHSRLSCRVRVLQYSMEHDPILFFFPNEEIHHTFYLEAEDICVPCFQWQLLHPHNYSHIGSDSFGCHHNDSIF